MEGNTALGASSPAKPALHSPDPLSHTRAVLSSSSHIFSSDFLPYSNRRQSLQENVIINVIYILLNSFKSPFGLVNPNLGSHLEK